MKDWEAHWREAPARFEPTQFLEQVGKTVAKKPVAEQQIGWIVEGVRARLDLSPDDRLLDLCCGNGLLTARFSAACRRVTGVDYSEPLLAVARAHNSPENVEYLRGDARELGALLAGRSFDKVVMYEALQHFTPREVEGMLRQLAALLAEGAPVLLASIPDRARLWTFHDTLRRRWDFVRRSLRGDPAIGTWWRREALADLAERNGFACEALDQDARLYTAHYRFDALLRRR